MRIKYKHRLIIFGEGSWKHQYAISLLPTILYGSEGYGWMCHLVWLKFYVTFAWIKC